MRRLALHIFLLLLTFLTTTMVGAGLARSFHDGTPADLDQSIVIMLGSVKHPGVLLDGLPFSLTLMLILLAHEMGHYLACLHYGIDATPPYFLPAPTLIGTFGAFIRIRSPIYTKRALFDVGIAGPLAGFFFLLPILVFGIANSKVVHGIVTSGDFIFGTPLVVRLLESAIFPGVGVNDIYLHPVARAAWVGIFSTALNLLPVGQLDGGHILYALIGEKHRLTSKIFIAALIPLGLFYSWMWLMWAIVLAIIGMRHPAIFDVSKMDANRTRLAWVALAIFILSFTASPLKPNFH